MGGCFRAPHSRPRGGGVWAEGRSPDTRKLWVIAVTLFAILAWSLSATLGVGEIAANPSNGSSNLTVATASVHVLPVIAQIVNFTITENTSGDTGPFDVAPSDTLVVFVELFGKTTVHNVTVENGPNDTFVQEAYLLDYVNGGTHGFSVWAATNVSGGPNTDVNVTLTGGTTDSAAIDVVDVNGGNPYGGNPVPFVDQVADIIHGNSNSPNEHLTVHANDLALAGIGTWSWNNFTAQAPAALADQVTTNSSVTGTNVTTGVLYYSNNNSTAESVWMNATLTSRAPWIEDIIAIGAVDYTTEYPVTFSETGLPSGTVWCQDIQSEEATQCGKAGSTWLIQNGTYDWNVSEESDENYVDPNLGNSGFLTVQGTSVDMSFNFTDPLQCGGSGQPACIQHVVVIVMENEPRSYVMDHGPSEKWLADTYEGASSFEAACHPSAPNYLALVAATSDQCGTDSYPSHAWKNVTLGDLLQNNTIYSGGSRDFTWANYAENLPSDACTNPSKYSSIQSSGRTGAALFFSKHVPFLYEQDTVYSSTFCEHQILSLEPGKYANYTSPSHPAFNTSVAEGKMLNFSFISPNACDDGHDLCGSTVANSLTGPNATCFDSAHPSATKCYVAENTVSSEYTQAIHNQADPWLRWFLGDLINCTGPYESGSAHSNCRQEMNHTVFFILYDEGLGGPTTRSSGGLTYKNAPGESKNDNLWWCNGDKYPTDYIATCGGNPYLVTVIPNGSLHAGKQGASFFTAKTSDYGITATIEWLFGLANFTTVHSSYLRGLSNPGYLDSLWSKDRLNLGGPDSPKSEFSFAQNGY